MKKVFRVLLGVITFSLCVLLCLGLIFSAAIYSVRVTFTNEFVYNTMSALDYSSLEFPDGNGGSATLAEMADENLGQYGISVSDEDVNSFIEIFSIDVIVTSFVQDFRIWLIDDGPKPTLNPAQMADIMVSGLDSGVYSLLSVFVEPTEMLTEILSEIVSSVDIDEMTESLEPIRDILSAGSFYLSLSCAGVLLLLILISRRMKFSQWLICSGSSITVCGILCKIIVRIAEAKKGYIVASAGISESLFDIIYLPLCDTFSTVGGIILLFGFSAVTITLVVIGIKKMLRG